MNAAELANENVMTVARGETLPEAAHLMHEAHVGDLVVVDEQDERRPVGILTDRDLVMAIAEHGIEHFARRKVEQEMSDVLIMARSQDPVDDVLQNMRDNGVRRIPVVDVDDELVGILTLDDLLGYYGDAVMKMGELVQKGLTREITGKG